MPSSLGSNAVFYRFLFCAEGDGRAKDMRLFIGYLTSPFPILCSSCLFCLVWLWFLLKNLVRRRQHQTLHKHKVMKYMPVVFSIFFFIFPAGLCLYSVVNSGFSLGQQRYLYKKTGVLGDVGSGGS
jgi:YidC/Oxa1 family membrane protein insertase